MSPFFVPRREMLNAYGTFDRFAVVPEAGVLHFAALFHKQTNQSIDRHTINRAFDFPVAFRIPLRCRTGSLKRPPINLLQNPVSKATAIKETSPAARVFFALGTESNFLIGTVEIYASALDGRMLCAVALVESAAIHRIAIFATCAEDV